MKKKLIKKEEKKHASSEGQQSEISYPSELLLFTFWLSSDVSDFLRDPEYCLTLGGKGGGGWRKLHPDFRHAK